jgi:hypothetical protein
VEYNTLEGGPQMKYHAALLIFVLTAAPAFAQNAEEEAIRELGMFGVYSLGNLALNDIQRGNDPVQQMKRFFAQAKLPLTSAQEKSLTALIDAEVKVLQSAGQNENEVRRVNADYTKKLNEVLNADQRAELRRYRAEQIMLRGGFPALKLVLENGNAPFNEEQEKQVQAIYLEFNQKVNALMRDKQGNPDHAELSALESQELGKVVRLLTPEQRSALAASRQGPFNARVKP